MIRALLILSAALAAAPALAQDRRTTDVAPGTRAASVAPAADGEIMRGQGALLRGLDKVSGQTSDLTLDVGESLRFGRLDVRLGECRYPAADKESDAFAQLTITDSLRHRTAFSGWMIASSPALSALDDARYDIWVVACNDGSGTARPDVRYEPDSEAPEGGEGMGPSEGAEIEAGEADSDASSDSADGNG